MTNKLSLFMSLLNFASIYGAGITDKSSTDKCHTLEILNVGNESLGTFPTEVNLLMNVLPPGEEIRLDLVQNDKLSLDDVAVHVIGEDGKTNQNRDLPSHGNVRFYHGFSSNAVIRMKIVHYKPGVEKAYFKGTLTHQKNRYRIQPLSSSSYTKVEVVHELCQLPADNAEEEQREAVKATLGGADPEKSDPSWAHDWARQTPYPRDWNLDMLDRFSDKEQMKNKSEYHVEMGIVIDHSIWDDMMTLTLQDKKAATSEVMLYLGHLVNGMNMIYRSIPTSSGSQIHVWMKKIYIAETRDASIWTAKHIVNDGVIPSLTLINSTEALSSLEEWRQKDGRNWAHPDYVLLLTRYDIDGKNATIRELGLTPVGGICLAGIGISVIEDKGLDTFRIAAHELGHNLGAQHDDGKCPPFFVMYSTYLKFSTLNYDTYISRAFQFSPCSVRAMLDVLSGRKDGYPRVCLHNRVCQRSLFATRNYTLDEQCQMVVGTHSFFCPKLYKIKNGSSALSAVCRILLCYTGRSKCADVSYAQDGAYCGSTRFQGNMYCHKGSCLSKSSIPEVEMEQECRATILSVVPAGCDFQEKYNSDWRCGCYDEPYFRAPHKDSKTNEMRLIGCGEIVRLVPHTCFSRDDIKTSCCRSCHLFGLVSDSDTDTDKGPLHKPRNREADIIMLTKHLTTVSLTTTSTTTSTTTTTLNNDPMVVTMLVAVIVVLFIALTVTLVCLCRKKRDVESDQQVLDQPDDAVVSDASFSMA